MNIEKATELLNILEEDKIAQNLIAQSNAKYILLHVKESRLNFPKFDARLENKLSSIAFSYLSVGCTLFENEKQPNSLYAIEKAADILTYCFSYEENQKNQKYLLIIGGLSYYIAGQYSKAFLSINKVKYNTTLLNMLGAYLRKDFQGLLEQINSVLLNKDYEDSSIVRNDDDDSCEEKIYTVLFAKSFSNLLEFIYNGAKQYFEIAKDVIRDLKGLAEIDEEPAVWWLSRLLLIVFDNFEKFSLWNNLLPIAPSDQNTLIKYIRTLAFCSPAITELFETQYNSLSKIQDFNGAVFSLSTSSGKTRIAEIAILNTILNNREAKVLYLAPFRSLAFEIEESFSKIFNKLEISVTHLYGGGQFNRFDKKLIDESSIIIATPEKAKAIIRTDEQIINSLRLVIVDEGHLLGTTERFIQNEMFIEELKYHIEKNKGKFILLSAVLPNPSNISTWLTKKESNYYNSDWRPSSQRLGLLKWTGKNVNIEWFGDERVFNNNFIKPFKPKHARKYIPNDKKQAVAASAVKFMNFGSVLVFVAQSRMVLSQAQEIYKSMGENAKFVSWTDKFEWEEFKLSCEEAFGNDSVFFNLAKHGILCHSAKLPSEVRIAIEKLMRLNTPKIIVATSTLGQGVNIGISTVIFANVFINNGDRVQNKDFWNIAGRAGRAFTDLEGKILYVLDETKETWQKDNDYKLMLHYFDKSKMEVAQSGLLGLIKIIFNIANKCDISFQLLLEYVAENNFTNFVHKDNITPESVASLFDFIDDTLLSLNNKINSDIDFNSSDWIDNFFRNSLAYIQSLEDESISSEDIISFFKARNLAVLRMAKESTNMQTLIKSSIPLSASIYIEKNIDVILDGINIYNDSMKELSDLITLFSTIELFICSMPSLNFQNSFDTGKINEVRKIWLSGDNTSELYKDSKTQQIVVKYFAFTIPWAINAISKRLYDLSYENESELFEDLALISELGLPNIFAIKIYLSGIRSRIAATELSNILNKELATISTLKLSNILVENLELLKRHCSNYTMKWITMLSSKLNTPLASLANIDNFSFTDNVKVSNNVLNIRKFGDEIFLCSPDYEDKISINSNDEFPFDKLANNTGVYFQNDPSSNSWQMQVRNPHLLKG